MSPVSRITTPIKQAASQIKSWGETVYRNWKIRRQPEVEPLIPGLEETIAKPERKSLRGANSYQVGTVKAEKKTVPADALAMWEGEIKAKDLPEPLLDQTSPPNYQVAQPLVSPVTGDEPSLAEEIREVREQTQQENLEKGLGIGVASTAAVMSATFGIASEIQPSPDAADFSHILQKDTPIDQMVTFFEHNSLAMVDKGSIPLIATNQTISIEDTLDKTPVRGFDIDLHMKDGEVVINHAGFFNPLVPDENIPRLEDAISPINNWLDNPSNGDEVIFLNFENKQYLNTWELRSVFGDKLMMGNDYDDMVRQLGRTPTVNELTADGPKVIIVSHDHFITPGIGNVGIGGFSHMPSLWEDRTLAEVLGPEYHDDVAPKITTEDIDTLIEKGQGRFISLDQVSANDPRFLKPEDRVEHSLQTDDSMFGHLYYGNEHFQSALMGASAAASTASGALGIAGGIFQGVQNERQIRNQPKHVAQHLQQVELLDVLQKRKRKDLGSPVTAAEIERLYTRQKQGEITRRTLMPGLSGTVSVSGSLLSLGMIFAPMFPAMAAAAAATGGAGLLSTVGATIANRRRMSRAIKQSFESQSIKKLAEHTAKRLEQKRLALLKGEDISDPKAAEKQLTRTLKKRTHLTRLQKASQFILGGSLLVRVSGLSKYGLPMLGSVVMGIGAALTGVMVAVSAAINFKERRQKLSDLPGTVTEVLNPKLDSKRFWFFGSSRFERYLKKYQETLQNQHPVLAGMSVKQMSRALLHPGTPQKVQEVLHTCRRQSALAHWETKLTRFARRRKPYRHFQDIRKKPEDLRALLKTYAINEVGKFAHDDCFRSGRNNTIKLALMGAFGSIFYLPLIGVSAGTLAIGLGVSKIVAEVERQVFKRRLRRTMDQPGIKPKDKAAHQAVNQLVDAWTGMLGETGEPEKTKEAKKPPLSDIKI